MQIFDVFFYTFVNLFSKLFSKQVKSLRFLRHLFRKQVNFFSFTQPLFLRDLFESSPTVTRQSPDGRPTVTRQSPDGHPTVTRRSPDSHSIEKAPLQNTFHKGAKYLLRELLFHAISSNSFFKYLCQLLSNDLRRESCLTIIGNSLPIIILIVSCHLLNAACQSVYIIYLKK